MKKIKCAYPGGCGNRKGNCELPEPCEKFVKVKEPMKQQIILIALMVLGLALVLAATAAHCQVRVDTLWRPLPQKTLLMGDCVNTYAGDSIPIYRENEIGMYSLDTSLCVLKITEKKNGITDILTCDKSIYRLKPKQFFRR